VLAKIREKAERPANGARNGHSGRTKKNGLS
jgi:hypothetical protein